MCGNVKLDPSRFITAPGLPWQTALEKSEAKIELLSSIGVLLMVEKGVRGRICHVFHQYVKVNTKYMKSYNKGKEWSHLKYWDINNFYEWEMLHKLSVDGLSRI